MTRGEYEAWTCTFFRCGAQFVTRKQLIGHKLEEGHQNIQLGGKATTSVPLPELMP